MIKDPSVREWMISSEEAADILEVDPLHLISDLPLDPMTEIMTGFWVCTQTTVIINPTTATTPEMEHQPMVTKEPELTIELPPETATLRRLRDTIPIATRPNLVHHP